MSWFESSSSVGGWIGYGETSNPFVARCVRWSYKSSDCPSIFRIGNRAGGYGNGTVPYTGSPNRWCSWRVCLIENN